MVTGGSIGCSLSVKISIKSFLSTHRADCFTSNRIADHLYQDRELIRSLLMSLVEENEARSIKTSEGLKFYYKGCSCGRE